MNDTSKSVKNQLASLQKKGAKENSFTVVKRNGSLVPFRRERIFNAIEKAFCETKQINKDLPTSDDVLQTINEVTDAVVEQLITLASQGTCLSVEGIQDLVEVTLMRLDHHDVAKDYIIYRDQHKALREDSPQNVKVARKDGSIVRFNPMKVAETLEESFRRSKKTQGPSDELTIERVNIVMQKVVAKVVTLAKTGEAVPVDTIQDEIEHQLMQEGFFAAAKDFILNRASLGEQSETPLEEREKENPKQRQFITINQNGQKTFIAESKIYNQFRFACRGFEDLVSADLLLEESVKNFYEEMKETEVDQAGIMQHAPRSKSSPLIRKLHRACS